jgi:hypothetical protein
MQDTIKPQWLKLSAERLFNHLMFKGYPPAMIHSIQSHIANVKAAQRAQKIKRTVGDTLWYAVLRPARAERGNVKTMKAQTRRELNTEGLSDEQRDALRTKLTALEVYDGVVTKTIERLHKAQKAGTHTPQQFAKALVDAGKLPVGVDGTHWTDYVSDKDRELAEKKYQLVADPKRGRRKELFARTTTLEEHAKQRDALWERMETDLAMAQQELDLLTDTDEMNKVQARIMQIEQAKFALCEIPRNAHLPNTWRGLIGLR